MFKKKRNSSIFDPFFFKDATFLYSKQFVYFSRIFAVIRHLPGEVVFFASIHNLMLSHLLFSVVSVFALLSWFVIAV